MKPVLAIGLGNPLMGDDGVGCIVAERLVTDARLPEYAEVICGGSDLLGCAGQMEGRDRVVVIDALQSDTDPGNVVRLDGADCGVEERQDHAHHLSAVQAMRLLERISSIRCTLLGVSISSATVGSSLSPGIEAQLPAILEQVLEELGRHPQENRGLV